MSLRREWVGRPLWVAAVGLALGCRATTAVAPAPVAAVIRAPAPPPADHDPLDQPPPMNPAVRTGKLQNGMTFYVLNHGAPEKRAALWLAVDAGSALESDDQRGLAHFVEHMAFDGTRRFPRHEITRFIEKAGMVMGPDLNAYTGFDQTVYQLTVPSEDPAIWGRGLDVLRDIAGDVSFDAAEVDRERGIVLEEWRQKLTAHTRVGEQQVAAYLRGSRYVDRLPIGTPEIIKTVRPEALARFYRAWYRPESMAVIAVGDFDAAAMEQEIRARFGDFVNPTPAPPRPSLAVPHGGEPTTVYISDPEARTTTVAVAIGTARQFERTKREFRRTLLERLFDRMDSLRLAELRDDVTSPLVGSEAGRSKLTRTAVVYLRKVTVKEGRLAEALALLFREIAQTARYGFLPSELELAKNEELSLSERFTLEYDRSSLRERAGEIVRHFTEHEEMSGPALEIAWIRELLPTISLAELNALAKARALQQGEVVAISAPASGKPVAHAEVRAIALELLSHPLPLWTDSTPNEPLLASLPQPGKVVASAVDAAADATVWTLANGIRVVVKPTTFRQDTIGIIGWRPGGTSLVSDDDFPSARVASEIVGVSGAGKFSQRSLFKLIAGKTLSLSIGLGEIGGSVSADTSPDNLETLLQILYLRLVKPRQDERAFSIWKSKRLEAVRHDADSPEQRFSDAIAVLTNGNHPRRRPVTAEAIEAVDGAKAFQIFSRAFSDFGGFTFVFVGNFAPERLRPLVETYLGSLPGTPSSPRWKDIGVAYPKGKVEKTIVAGRDPKSLVMLSFDTPARFTVDGERDARVLEALLRIRLRELLREGMSAVYNVGVSSRLVREPTVRQLLSISFGCAPENVAKLRQAVFAALGDVARHGADPEILAKVAEQLRRQHELDLRNNGWWLARLREAYTYDEDFGQQNDLDALLGRVTAANVQATARRIFDEKKYVLAVLRPEGTP